MKTKKKKVAVAQGADSPIAKSVAVATAEAPKVKKIKTKELDEKNAENVKAKITKEKDLMYQYPADTATLETRKTFRANARRKLSSFQKSIAKAAKEEKSELIKSASDWAKGIYATGHVPSF